MSNEQCWCGAIGEHDEHWYESAEAAEADLALFRAEREARRLEYASWTTDPNWKPPPSERDEVHATAIKVINEINRARITVGKMLGVVPENVEPEYRARAATAVGMYDEIPGESP